MLLHLSFKNNLSGTLIPRAVAGSELGLDAIYPEPNTPRVCFGPSVLKCFQAIYPNISDFFEVKKYPYMDFYVYRTKSNSPAGLIPNAEIVANHWVHDAHVTGESWVVKPVEVYLYRRVRIKNTNSISSLNYHPFGDQKESLRTLAPKTAVIELLPLNGSDEW